MKFKYNDTGIFSYADEFRLGRTNSTPDCDSYPGTNGNDKYNGLAGGDLIHGLKGNDLLRGVQMEMQSTAMEAKTHSSGGADGDARSGGKGNDIMTGDTGGDSFVFATRFGADVVTDFNATTVVPTEHDVINLSNVESITDFNDLIVNHLEREGHDLVIRARNGDTLRLEDVRLKDIDSGARRCHISSLQDAPHYIA